MILPERFWSCNALTSPGSIAEKGFDHIKSAVDLFIRDAVRWYQIDDISEWSEENAMFLSVTS
jgi:hypothetical protein